MSVYICNLNTRSNAQSVADYFANDGHMPAMYNEEDSGTAKLNVNVPEGLFTLSYSCKAIKDMSFNAQECRSSV